MHMPVLPYFLGPLVLLETLIDMLHTPTILATACFALASDHILFIVLQLAFGLVVHAAHLTQLIELRHSLLTHHCLCQLLSLF